LKSPILEERLERPADLWSQVRKKQHQPLLRAINQYMSYGLLGLGDDLELWTQYDTERRELKPGVQISLGTALSDSFELRRSAVIANRPVNRDSPDESQSGINVRVFPALLQDRREVPTATSTSGNPSAWSRV
jgi:hypothetical protein